VFFVGKFRVGVDLVPDGDHLVVVRQDVCQDL